MKLRYFLQSLFQKIGLKRQIENTVAKETPTNVTYTRSAGNDDMAGCGILTDDKIDLDPRLKHERHSIIGARRNQLAHQQERCG